MHKVNNDNIVTKTKIVKITTTKHKLHIKRMIKITQKKNHKNEHWVTSITNNTHNNI